MIIKKYRDIPRTYCPDVGEVIMGRRTATDVYTKAVVVHVRRMRDGSLSFRVVWREDNPDVTTPIEAGKTGWIVARPGAWPSLIQQIDKDQAADS